MKSQNPFVWVVRDTLVKGPPTALVCAPALYSLSKCNQYFCPIVGPLSKFPKYLLNCRYREHILSNIRESINKLNISIKKMVIFGEKTSFKQGRGWVIP